MPPKPHDKALSQAAAVQVQLLCKMAAVGEYPLEALDFVQRGLAHTVAQVHGAKVVPGSSRHVSGQQLCKGLREYAQERWGMMARLVLRRWNIRQTLDFGRIVFNMVDAGLLKTTEEDSLDDFRDVFDFASFDSGYRIESKL